MSILLAILLIIGSVSFGLFMICLCAVGGSADVPFKDMNYSGRWQ